MEKINLFLKPFFEFITTNILQIIVALVVTGISGLIFYFTLRSLKKLKPETFSYYPFDRFLPQSSSWSIGYFIVLILFMFLLLLFMFKGEFYLIPS